MSTCGWKFLALLLVVAICGGALVRGDGISCAHPESALHSLPPILVMRRRLTTGDAEEAEAAMAVAGESLRRRLNKVGHMQSRFNYGT